MVPSMGDFPDLRSRDDIQRYLRHAAQSIGVALDSDAVAAELDRRDPVAHLRSCFNVPTVDQLMSEGERSPGMVVC